MKIEGYTFDFSMKGRVAILRGRLGRARYFRGHGVHSPYIYDIVRKVFMRHDLMEGDHALYEALLGAGIRKHDAVQLQNLAFHCHFERFSMRGEEADLRIVSRDVSRQDTLAIIADARLKGQTVVVLQPYANVQRMMLCQTIVAQHRCTTVDKWGYLVVFNNHLPKQHFKI